MPENRRCAGCDAAILWATTAATGRPIPLDAEPHPSGNVVLDDQGRAVVLSTATLFDGPVPEGPRYQSHFAACPSAKTYRRRP